MLVCVVCLCGQECDPAMIDGASGFLQGVGAGLYGSSDENAQVAGLAAWMLGKAIEIVRSPSTDYDPEVSASLARLGHAAGTLTVTLSGTNPQQPEQNNTYQANPGYAHTTVSYDHSSSDPSKSSSITQSPAGQNTGAPRINQLMTPDGVVLSDAARAAVKLPLPQPRPNPPAKTGGYVFRDDAARQSCVRLSSVGKEILSAIDGVAKELNITITITDGDRPLETQLSILLERPNSYSIATKDFEKEFGKPPPKTKAELTAGERKWYTDRIKDLAGTGFPHVGGSAIDIYVGNLSDKKEKMVELFTVRGVKILFEAPPDYGVTVGEARVFHLHK